MSTESDDVRIVFIYRCRKCRLNLEITDAVLEPDIGNCNLSKTTIDLEPDVCPTWILDAVNQSGWTKGKLKCEKCSGRLGSFDFVKDNTCEGRNGRHQHSAVHLNRDRVDVLKTSSSFTVKDSVRGKVTSCDRQGRNPKDLETDNVGQEIIESKDNINNNVPRAQCFQDSEDQFKLNETNWDVNDESLSLFRSTENATTDAKREIPCIHHTSEFKGSLKSGRSAQQDVNFIQDNHSNNLVHQCDAGVIGEKFCENKFKQSTDQSLKGQTFSCGEEAEENILVFDVGNVHNQVVEDVCRKSYADSVKCESVRDVTQKMSESSNIGASCAKNTGGNKTLLECYEETIKDNSDSKNNLISFETNEHVKDSDLVAGSLVVPCDDEHNRVTKGKWPGKAITLDESQNNLKTICDKMDAPAQTCIKESYSCPKALKAINFQSICDKMDSDISGDRDKSPSRISDIDTYFDNNEANTANTDNELRLVQERLLDRDNFQEMDNDSRRKYVMSKGDYVAQGPSSQGDGSATSNDLTRSEENRFLALESDEPNKDEDNQIQTAEQEYDTFDLHETEVKRRRAQRRSEKRQRKRFKRRFGYVYGPRFGTAQEDNTDYSCPPIEELLEEEDVPNEMSCPVCLEILFSPYKCRPCDHIFCEICLRRIARQQPNCTLCPMCRKVIRACVSDTDLGNQLCEEYPRLYKRRQAEMQRSKVHKLPLPRSSWRETAFRNAGFLGERIDEIDVPVLKSSSS